MKSFHSFNPFILLFNIPILFKQVFIYFLCSKYILLTEDTVFFILKTELDWFLCMLPFFCSLCAEMQRLFNIYGPLT